MGTADECMQYFSKLEAPENVGDFSFADELDSFKSIFTDAGNDVVNNAKDQVLEPLTGALADLAENTKEQPLHVQLLIGAAYLLGGALITGCIRKCYKNDWYCTDKVSRKDKILARTEKKKQRREDKLHQLKQGPEEEVSCCCRCWRWSWSWCCWCRSNVQEFVREEYDEEY